MLGYLAALASWPVFIGILLIVTVILIVVLVGTGASRLGLKRAVIALGRTLSRTGTAPSAKAALAACLGSCPALARSSGKALAGSSVSVPLISLAAASSVSVPLESGAAASSVPVPLVALAAASSVPASLVTLAAASSVTVPLESGTASLAAVLSGTGERLAV